MLSLAFRYNDRIFPIAFKDTLDLGSDWSPSQIRTAQEQVYTTSHINRCVHANSHAQGNSFTVNIQIYF